MLGMGARTKRFSSSTSCFVFHYRALLDWVIQRHEYHAGRSVSHESCDSHRCKQFGKVSDGRGRNSGYNPDDPGDGTRMVFYVHCSGCFFHKPFAVGRTEVGPEVEGREESETGKSGTSKDGKEGTFGRHR